MGYNSQNQSSFYVTCLNKAKVTLENGIFPFNLFTAYRFGNQTNALNVNKSNLATIFIKYYLKLTPGKEYQWTSSKIIRYYKIIFSRKIPTISPGLIFVQKALLLGLFSGELIFGGVVVLMFFLLAHNTTSKINSLSNPCQ